MVDWAKPELTLVQEIVREAELNLQGQLSLAIAADQRSSAMASLFTAAAAAVVAGLMSVAAAGNVDTANAIYAGGGVVAALFVAAAALCVLAARPLDFYIPGNEPQQWYADVDAGRDLKTCLGQQAENYQAMIDSNLVAMTANSRRFTWGAAIGTAAPVIGLVIWKLVVHAH